jgi:hypothetical protein
METTASTIATIGVVVAVIVVLPATGFAAAGVVVSTAGSNADPGFGAPGSGTGIGTSATGHQNAANASRNGSGNGSVAPGAMLSGVVGVGEAEIEGEVTERAFGLRIANAASNASKAGVVGEQFREIRDRLAGLRQEKRDLGQARENGSLSEGQYRARLAALNTKVQSVKRLANRTEDATRGLPDALLREKGVDVTAIRTLKRNASELAGPEVAAIARQIAGPDAGKSLGRGPGGTGPPGLNGSVGPPDRNESAGGPPDRNDSTAGSPERDDGQPIAPGNRASGNETRGVGGENGTHPVGDDQNGSAPAGNASGNSSAPLEERDWIPRDAGVVG